MREARSVKGGIVKSVLRNVLSSFEDVRRAQMNSNTADSN